MSKHRGKKRNNYINESDKIMHNLNELFVPGTKKTDSREIQRNVDILSNGKNDFTLG